MCFLEIKNKLHSQGNTMISKQTFGVPNTWVIYIIAGASLVEAVIFIILHAGIIENMEWYSDMWDDDHHIWNKWPGSIFKKVEQVTYVSIVVQSARIIFAMILAIGRYQKQSPSLVIFIFCTVIGILANLGTGIYAHQYGWTRNLAVASFVVILLHIAYIVVAVKIYKQEKEVTPGPSATHGHIPVVPIQVPPIVVNQQQNVEPESSYSLGNMHPTSEPYGHLPGHSHSLPQPYGNFSGNMHSVPQQYGQSSAIMHPVPQPYAHPQDIHTAPQTYVHPQGNVHAVQPTPPPYYQDKDERSDSFHTSPVMEEKKTNVYNAF